MLKQELEKEREKSTIIAKSLEVIERGKTALAMDFAQLQTELQEVKDERDTLLKQNRDLQVQLNCAHSIRTDALKSAQEAHDKQIQMMLQLEESREALREARGSKVKMEDYEQLLETVEKLKLETVVL